MFVRAPGFDIKKSFVLDCSVTMSWFFSDEKNIYGDAVATYLGGMNEKNSESAASGQAYAWVPSVWYLEVANVMLVAERKQRCTRADIVQWKNFLSGLPIFSNHLHHDFLSVRATDASPFERVMSLGREQQISAYDASYLLLALEGNMPLATFDKKMEQAAQKLGIRLFNPSEA